VRAPRRFRSHRGEQVGVPKRIAVKHLNEAIATAANRRAHGEAGIPTPDTPFSGRGGFGND
jgi:hypothetical protein